MNKTEVSLAEAQGPLTEAMQQFSGKENGRQRFEEFLLWLKNATAYLRSLFADVEVDATDGTKTFQSSGLFGNRIYGLAVPDAAKGKPTSATKANVWEMIRDGMFALIFGSLGKIRVRWTEHQVVEFYEKHRDKLRTEGYATFFEMEGGVVASVDFDGRGQLEVFVYSFSDDDGWDAEYRHRVVSLQQ